MNFDDNSIPEVDYSIKWEEIWEKEEKEGNKLSISLLRFYGKMHLKYSFTREGIQNSIRKHLEEIIIWLEGDIYEYNHGQNKDHRGTINWR